jgi:hypothetical protein
MASLKSIGKSIKRGFDKTVDFVEDSFKDVWDIMEDVWDELRPLVSFILVVVAVVLFFYGGYFILLGLAALLLAFLVSPEAFTDMLMYLASWFLEAIGVIIGAVGSAVAASPLGALFVAGAGFVGYKVLTKDDTNLTISTPQGGGT